MLISCAFSALYHVGWDYKIGEDSGYLILGEYKFMEFLKTFFRYFLMNYQLIPASLFVCLNLAYKLCISIY